ncbi:MAG: 50S ribosomal protein L25/general stress protein Ctc [Bacteroidales bacterium]|nr:50S ribosomal protein L25/general stress protein Ctc [Bacteroidales bacterium]
MLTIDLAGQSRTNLGKKESKHLRAAGSIPCVLYGVGENQNFTVEAKAFDKVIITPNVYVVNLNIDGASHKAILKEVQFHPVTDEVLHVDFLEVTDEKPFEIKLPIKIVGHSEGVKQGGKLKVKMRKMKVSGLLKDLPAELVVDVTSLGLGQSIKLASLSFEGLNIEDPKSSVVCSVLATRDSNKK